MIFKKKHREAKQAEPEKPPFPLDKPNSCEFCKHNYCTGTSYRCDAYYGMNKRIETWWWSKGGSAFRTWDRCDDYAPIKTCKTCKYGPIQNMITETRIIGDEEVEVTMPPSINCPHKSECKNSEKWEPKEMNE